jgi:hypothetical protein
LLPAIRAVHQGEAYLRTKFRIGSKKNDDGQSDSP